MFVNVFCFDGGGLRGNVSIKEPTNTGKKTECFSRNWESLVYLRVLFGFSMAWFGMLRIRVGKTDGIFFVYIATLCTIRKLHFC